MTPASLRIVVLASALGAGACASTGAVPRPFPTPGAGIPRSGLPGAIASGDPTAPLEPPAIATPPVGGASAAGFGYAVAGTALSLRGAPYRSGGVDPSGFDCSGFIWYVFAQHGIHVPRTVVDQFHEGMDVASSALEPGDLLFFSTEAPGASHVGMAIGGDQFVHAPSSRGIVRVERLSATYWSSRYVGAKRMR